MYSSSREEAVAAFDNLDTALNRVLKVSPDDLTIPECLAMLQRCEKIRRRLPAAEHPFINKLADQTDQTELGGKLPFALAERLHISRGEASRRIHEAAEIMWAEHQLTQTRLAIEAQAEIDREQQRRRVVEALEGPVRASSERTLQPVEDEVYLPIAAETEAASRTVAQLPAGAAHHRPGIAKNLPAQVQPEGAVEPREKRATPVIRSIPDATKAAARWIRPLVPPFVARMLDNTTAPLRTARQVFEEVEEIAFSFKRTHKVTVNAEGSDPNDQPPLESHSPAAPAESNPIASSDSARRSRLATNDDHPPLAQVPPRDLASLSVGSTGELTQREGPHELRSPDGPRQLPPPR